VLFKAQKFLLSGRGVCDFTTPTPNASKTNSARIVLFKDIDPSPSADFSELIDAIPSEDWWDANPLISHVKSHLKAKEGFPFWRRGRPTFPSFQIWNAPIAGFDDDTISLDRKFSREVKNYARTNLCFNFCCGDVDFYFFGDLRSGQRIAAERLPEIAIRGRS
jgi:hypothetical protein